MIWTRVRDYEYTAHCNGWDVRKVEYIRNHGRSKKKSVFEYQATNTATGEHITGSKNKVMKIVNYTTQLTLI